MPTKSSTKPPRKKSALREDMHKGRSLQVPRSLADRNAAIATSVGLPQGSTMRLFLAYAIQEYEAGRIIFQLPPGLVPVPKQPTIVPCNVFQIPQSAKPKTNLAT